jgi:hypothetical protein
MELTSLTAMASWPPLTVKGLVVQYDEAIKEQGETVTLIIKWV